MKSYFVLLVSLIISGSAFSQKVELVDIKNYVGSAKPITVCGKIFGGIFLKTANNKPTLLNMGGTYPNHLLTLVITEDNLKNFPEKPEEYFSNAVVCVTGNVIEYNGKPEIVLKSADQIQLQTQREETETPSSRKENPERKENPQRREKPEKRESLEHKEAAERKEASEKTDTAINIDTAERRTTKVSKEKEIKLTHGANLRSAPSTNSPILFVIGSGSTLTVLSSKNGWSWVMIKSATNKQAKIGEVGFIKNSAL